MGPVPPHKPKRVLLFTNSEHGQANVYLATSYALLTLPDEDVEVHFASFDPIRKFVIATSQHAKRENKVQKALRNRLYPHRPIIFHRISGIDMVTAWEQPEVIEEQEALSVLESGHKWWTVRSILTCSIRRMILLLRVTLPWTGPEFVEIFWSVIGIVWNAQPDIIAVDPAFSPALTALRHINARFVVLSPNTIKDFAMPLQPRGEALWKYPCTGMPFPYPVPLHQIPTNIFLILLAIFISFALDSRRVSIQKYVHQHADGTHLTTLNDLSLKPHHISGAGKTKFLVANLPELEFPLSAIPDHIVPCGPMIRPAKPVIEADPDLSAWLARGPTVYINLGTHMRFKEEFAVEMATAIRILLDHALSVLWRDTSKRLEGLQVLWKLSKKGEYEVLRQGSAVYDILGTYIQDGYVRIVDWIEAEPTAVLESGRIVCAVHHGGANSFLETVCAGIPQVVLPVWMDTYDFARRAEILGIGRWGNQNTDGKVCKAEELGSILIDVLVGGRSSIYEQNARRLAEKCKDKGGGRVKAARYILAEIPDSSHENGGGKSNDRADDVYQVNGNDEKEKDGLLNGYENGKGKVNGHS